MLMSYLGRMTVGGKSTLLSPHVLVAGPFAQHISRQGCVVLSSADQGWLAVMIFAAQDEAPLTAGEDRAHRFLSG